MSDILIGLIGIFAMFGLMIFRMPVGMSMMSVGFFGIWYLSGSKVASALLVTEAYSASSNYALTVVPLFILMGNISSAVGFSKSLYEAAFAWVGRFRGGLASASILGCAAFAAVSGSSVATAITIGKVALPEMKRHGYADSLATGSIAAGGTLGFLIPPSTGFVLYAILTEESIGKLFMAGIIPGLLLTALFIATIMISTTLDKSAGPKGNKVSLRGRMIALFKAMPLILVIGISIGGIYAGIFTPVEAAGIGAIMVAILALFSGKLTALKTKTVLFDTVKTTAMLYLIVIGANVLSPFLALTHIPSYLGEGLNSLGLGAYGTLMVILLAYIILGMFMDGLSMLVISIPIVYPVMMSFGFDPIWFGVIAVIVIEMGMITPPVGINVFVVKSVAEEVPMLQIFKGVLPFWFAMIICLGLIIIFPSIALIIPDTMFN